MSSLIEVPRKDIDTTKWSELIHRSNNGLIYHSIAYLDTMTDQWSALVLDDYHAALPLTDKKFLGYQLLQQPPFTQQLGIIGNDLSEETLNLFKEQLKLKYDYISYTLNFANALSELEKKTNYILFLNESYENLSNNFNGDVQANIKKSYRYPFTYQKNDDPQKTILLFKKTYGQRFRHIKNKNYYRLIEYCKKNLQGWISREVYLEDQLCASCLLLKDNKRLYFIINHINALGRDTEANYFMIDQFMREFAGSDLILDFEGSDLPGVSAFYKKFGAIDQPYYKYTSNNLPRILKLFKK